MRRFFAKNLLFVVGINLLVKPLWIFLIDRNVQNRVGYAAYGTYQALWNLTVIFQIILDFGLNSYNTRAISREPEKFAELFPVLFTARILLMGVFTALVMGVAFAMGYRGYELLLLGGIVIFQSLAIMLLFVRSNVAALQRFRMDGVLSVIDRLLMILICGLLLFLPATAQHFRIGWFVGAQITCYLIAVLTGIFMLRHIVQMPRIISFHPGNVLRIIREGAPYALLTFLMAIYMRSDAVLVERLCGAQGKEQAGIYAAAYRLLDVTNMISIMVAAVLMPLFGRMLAGKQDVSPIVRLCTNLLLPASLLLTVSGWVMGADIMHFLYHAAGAYHGRVFAWLMIAAPAYSLMYIYSTLLTANGHLGILNRLAGAGAVLNLVMNFLIVPHEQALGAAITAAVTQWVLAIGYIYFAAQKNALPTNPRWIIAHISYFVLLAATGFLLYQLNLPWKEKLALLIATAGVLVIAFRFISPKAVKALIVNR